jgi:hypothetical protein
MLSPTPQVRLTFRSSNQTKFELVVNLKAAMPLTHEIMPTLIV